MLLPMFCQFWMMGWTENSGSFCQTHDRWEGNVNRFWGVTVSCSPDVTNAVMIHAGSLDRTLHDVVKTKLLDC